MYNAPQSETGTHSLFGTCIKALLLLVLLCTGAWSRIVVEGTVPNEVSLQFIESEYVRIYSKIAPYQRPSRMPLRIVYYSSRTSALRFSLPEWGGGGAIGDSLIVIPTDYSPFLKQSFLQTTVHELVHIVIARAYPDLDVPRWFHEGLAMTLSGDVSFEEQSAISFAILFNRLMPLVAIDSVNVFTRSRADIAYSLSHFSMLYIIETYGFNAPFSILATARRMHNFNTGMRDVLGVSPVEFQEQANQYITEKYHFIYFVADNSFWWLGIGLLVIVAFIVTMHRNRKRALALEAEELQAELEKNTADKNNEGDNLPSEE